MPSFVLPGLPDGSRLDVLEVGAAPLVRRLLSPFAGRLPSLPSSCLGCLGVLALTSWRRTPPRWSTASLTFWACPACCNATCRNSQGPSRSCPPPPPCVCSSPTSCSPV